MTPDGIEPANFRFVVQHLNRCATAVPTRDSTRVLYNNSRWPREAEKCSVPTVPNFVYADFWLRCWHQSLFSLLPPPWVLLACLVPSCYTHSTFLLGTWLSCCATNRKAAGSITDCVIGILHWHNPSDRTIALGSTHGLTEMSTRSIYWG